MRSCRESTARFLTVFAAVGLFLPMTTIADGKPKLYIDSSTDRTPSTTAIPKYPRIARRDRIEGDATVCFRIDVNGRIKSVRVKSYTHRIFRRPALQAIKASSFEPLQSDERFTRERTCREYRFRLNPVVADTKE